MDSKIPRDRYVDDPPAPPLPGDNPEMPCIPSTSDMVTPSPNPDPNCGPGPCSPSNPPEPEPPTGPWDAARLAENKPSPGACYPWEYPAAGDPPTIAPVPRIRTGLCFMALPVSLLRRARSNGDIAPHPSVAPWPLPSNPCSCSFIAWPS